jgi:hypothetical protein
MAFLLRWPMNNLHYLLSCVLATVCVSKGLSVLTFSLLLSFPLLSLLHYHSYLFT